MRISPITPDTPSHALEKLSGIVKRVTFHSPESGWSVLKVTPFGREQEEIAVTVHQSKVFAGATIDFFGEWTNHPKFGRQFKAVRVEERKPATANALEKYLGSGLIKGVGPVTAKRIVKYFGKDTLEIFEHDIDRLTEVPGIAHQKLQSISQAWKEHQEIRNVMMFLQSHGISTLFAVKIYKTYGQQAVGLVSENPYRLSQDIYGIGFFSADKVALSLGLAPDSSARIRAAIAHVLQNAREEGHCYLTKEQILEQVQELIELNKADRIAAELLEMEKADELKTRLLLDAQEQVQNCYYAHSLYHDENYIAAKAKKMAGGKLKVEESRLQQWINRYCKEKGIQLSDEQEAGILQLVSRRLGILTGGPGCGKTTTTRVLVALLQAMGKDVLLAAPTGRAAQRMSEVIGLEAKTIHRLLEWDPAAGGFKRKEESPLECSFLIIDESSMLDVHLAAAVLRAIPAHAQLLLIGDADQLPSVGAGNVFKDLMASGKVSCARLTKVFRQAKESKIITYAHAINKGQVPKIDSPFHNPQLWQEKEDCLFIDSEEATQEQLRFISKVKRNYLREQEEKLSMAAEAEELYTKSQELSIPQKFGHVDLDRLIQADTHTDELQEVLKRVHPWSSLHWGYSAVDMVEKLYKDIIPKYYGKDTEIQILSPMSKGSLGTHHLNEVIQEAVNPARPGKVQLTLGGRTFREGDRIIQQRNNYDLNVFNGDIGRIISIDNENVSCLVSFTSGKETKEVAYEREHLTEIDLAYAITIHKSQGSEFEAIILPLVNQHFTMLFRNLIYTGLTRARKLAVFVGSRAALKTSVQKQNTALRQTALQWLMQNAEALE
ncbi:SF1B family DNA helicase RecD2 [Nafulsella turpanensis]|uniref:SF1B family DNA helicase RecD2 n=1 Tax=Nafulsella turpanensis TaxID=1265690 RepID=UPI0003467663|nr:AAA family ATPase [Nafulsella turpanensis]